MAPLAAVQVIGLNFSGKLRTESETPCCVDHCVREFDMNKQFILIPGLLLIGVLAGFFVKEQVKSGRVVLHNPALSPESISMAERPAATDTSRLEILEARVMELQARVELMAERYAVGELSEETEDENEGEDRTARNQPELFFEGSLITQTPTMLSSLISAGVDAFTAEEITRRQNEVDLARLVLRYKAIRDGYIRSPRYRDELQTINNGRTSIREEVGDEYFDRYLFASGRSNRIGVTSVMAGSAAESAGIEKGDLILRYGEQRLFEFRELQTATVEGDRTGLVDVTVMRDGFLVVMSIPRGPLGVRLSPRRIDPDNS